MKTAPCPLLVSEVLQLLLLPLVSVPPLGLQFHQVFVSRRLVLPGRFRGCRGALLSSTGYMSAAPTLASRRPGMLLGSTQCCTGRETAQPVGDMRVRGDGRQTHELTNTIGHANTRSLL